MLAQVKRTTLKVRARVLRAIRARAKERMIGRERLLPPARGVFPRCKRL